MGLTACHPHEDFLQTDFVFAQLRQPRPATNQRFRDDAVIGIEACQRGEKRIRIDASQRLQRRSTNAWHRVRQQIEEQLEMLVMNGDRTGLEDLLTILRVRYAPLEIINNILVPTMRRIGELFGAGKMLLPFVLKSAEVPGRA